MNIYIKWPIICMFVCSLKIEKRREMLYCEQDCRLNGLIHQYISVLLDKRKLIKRREIILGELVLYVEENLERIGNFDLLIKIADIFLDESFNSAIHVLKQALKNANDFKEFLYVWDALDALVKDLGKVAVMICYEEMAYRGFIKAKTVRDYRELLRRLEGKDISQNFIKKVEKIIDLRITFSDC
ncbi:MAG: hypothetical protein PHE21_00925 [Candidatus Dojkabacteria bacterium]|nr:hypothetical protein [Candidatus Dojkabacteria bacterium]